MRRSQLLALLTLLAVAVALPAAPASASDASINNAVAKRSVKLNGYASDFNSAIGTCNSSRLKSCGTLFRSAKRLRTITIRAARAVKSQRSSSDLGARAKRRLLRSFKAQRTSIESTTGFIRAYRRGDRGKASRLRKKGARSGKVARRNARLAQKLLAQIVARSNGG